MGQIKTTIISTFNKITYYAFESKKKKKSLKPHYVVCTPQIITILTRSVLLTIVLRYLLVKELKNIYDVNYKRL